MAPAPQKAKSLRYGLSSSQRRLQFAGLERLITMVDFFPVHYVPPSCEIFWPPIVVLQIIGVLPNVVAEDREEALGDWVVLIRRADDLNIAARFARQPNPTTAELFSAGN